MTTPMTPSPGPDAAGPAPAGPDAYAAAERRAIVAAGVPMSPLSIDGADAAAFLHAQLSSDINALAPGNGRWSSYNSPKGRVMATLFVGRLPDGPQGQRFVAWLAADLAPAIARRLRMFVLRSKVVIGEPGPDVVTIGLGGPEAAIAAREGLGLELAPGGVVEQDGTRAGFLPDGRALLTLPLTDLDAALARLGRVARPVPVAVWTWLGIRAAVPAIEAATSEHFVAQEANLDAIGALDFRKGCYPGQEIVARTQYLGRLKERLFLCEAAAALPAPGSRLFHPVFGDQACGEVVNAAPGPAGNAQFLAVLQIAASTAPGLALGAPDGPAVTVLPLPYALPAPSAPRVRLK